MKDTDLEFFRHLLTDWMEELLAHADNSVESWLDQRENYQTQWIELRLNRTGHGHYGLGTAKAC